MNELLAYSTVVLPLGSTIKSLQCCQSPECLLTIWFTTSFPEWMNNGTDFINTLYIVSHIHQTTTWMSWISVWVCFLHLVISFALCWICHYVVACQTLTMYYLHTTGLVFNLLVKLCENVCVSQTEVNFLPTEMLITH